MQKSGVYTYVTARFEYWPTLKRAAGFKAGRPALKPAIAGLLSGLKSGLDIYMYSSVGEYRARLFFKSDGSSDTYFSLVAVMLTRYVHGSWSVHNTIIHFALKVHYNCTLFNLVPLQTNLFIHYIT